MRSAAVAMPQSHELAQECVRLQQLFAAFSEALALYHGERGRQAQEEGGRARVGEGGLLPEALPKVTKIEKDYPRALHLFQEVLQGLFLLMQH